ncbi:MAG: hypothetical protein LBK53_07125 [Heliobacteriaceae bacterium]|nr:hypothetical protein [Heliobacteriaceae bacterium]
MEKTRQWGLRAEHEAKFHEDNCFITLTYAPENIPPSLEKRPLQLFLKRMRKVIHPNKIKYIASGELGDNYDNPHYHLCIFGYWPTDVRNLYERDGNQYYISATINNLWPYGFTIVTNLNFNTARYTAKYAIKKELGSKEKTRPAEFFVCSQGIGQAHVDKYSYDMAVKGSTYANNHGCSLPRYYKQKIKDTSNGVLLETTLYAIKKKILKIKSNITPVQKSSQQYANEIIRSQKI